MPVPEYIRILRQKVGHDLLMMPTADAIIFNTEGHILLQHRTDVDRWSIPGGAIEPNEEPAHAVIRETKEETGLDVLPERIIGVYSFTGTYPNGDKVCTLSVTFQCRVLGGQMILNNDETKHLRYFSPDNLPQNLVSFVRERIEHAMQIKQTFFRLKD